MATVQRSGLSLGRQLIAPAATRLAPFVAGSACESTVRRSSSRITPAQRRSTCAAAADAAALAPAPLACSLGKPAAPRRRGRCAAAADDADHAADTEEETVFYEGGGSDVELGLSIALGITLIYLPLTLASIGRRLWVKYRFTNKRVVVVTDSPALKREVAVAYSKVKEVRTVPRALGAWGDMVVFLKDGSRLEITGLPRYQEIRDHMEQFITEE